MIMFRTKASVFNGKKNLYQFWCEEGRMPLEWKQFKLILHKAIFWQKESLTSRSYQIFANADDIAILGREKKKIKRSVY